MDQELIARSMRELARVTSDAERFVRAVVALEARGEGCERGMGTGTRKIGERIAQMTLTPFDERVAALDADALTELMRSRHSVRAFTDRPIEGAVREALEAQVAAENERAGLSMQLCLDASGAFDGRLAHYGSFRNVRNHLALVGPAGPGLDEAVGYAGETPTWFAAGVEAARLAPTALNQQRFRFELLEDGRTVRARALPAVSCGKVDLGIARLHFELGANAVSRDWAFEG